MSPAKQLPLLRMPSATIREYVRVCLQDFAIRQKARDQKRAAKNQKDKRPTLETGGLFE